MRWLSIEHTGRLAAVLLLTGCHHYPNGPMYYNAAPYSPGPVYGPSMAPTPGYMAPGPVYTPQPGPTPLPGNPNSPTPINPGSTAPTWRPDTSGGGSTRPLDDAPPFRPNPGSNNNLVPDPLEPGFDSSPPPAASLPRATPIMQASTTPAQPAIPAQPVSNAGADPFETPRRLPAMPTQADPFEATPAATEASKQTPYGYDDQGYAWLRGIVDFDPQSGTWSIIYNLTPDIDDKFGGSFVFAGHESLKSLKPGTLVLAKGRADPGRSDARGKPLYEISQLVILAAPSGIQ